MSYIWGIVFCMVVFIYLLDYRLPGVMNLMDMEPGEACLALIKTEK